MGKLRVREQSVEQYLVRSVEQIGCKCIKFIPDNMVGMPDRLVLLPDAKVLWVELKTDGGVVSTIQQYRHKELGSYGQEVCVLYDKADVDKLIDKLKSKMMHK